MTPAKTLTADIKEAVNGSFEELYLRNCICKAYCRPIINFFADRLVMKSLPPQEGEFDLLLCPLHMNQSHWGLIATDLVGKKLLFDDGYKLQSDSSIKPSMKYLLDVLHELRPNAQCFSSSFWSTADHFERFGMPLQNCDSTGQGSGSCGVGVILIARDFILKGPTNAVCQVGWKYTQMRKLRKQLMIQIIAWASA